MRSAVVRDTGLCQALLFVSLLGLSACSSEKEELEACYRKGITYYREIGSYPSLSDGRDANTVIGERCARSKLAFG